MSRYVSLLLIVGREAEEDAEPFVVGAFNNEYMNQIDIETTDQMINVLKDTWTGDRSAYDWRECNVLVPVDQLNEMFKTPVLEAHVEVDTQ